MTTTQNCAECGTRAEPGQSFCDACGAVLSWKDREPRSNRPSTAADPTPDPSNESDGTAGRREAADGELTDTGGSASSGTDASNGDGASGAGFGGTAGVGSASGGASHNAPGSGADTGASGDPSGRSGAGGVPASASAAGSGTTAPTATSAAAGPASSAASDHGPGWDAFSRPDGGAGLAHTPRDLLVSGTTTASPSADHPTTSATPATDADQNAPGTDAPAAAAAPNSPSPSASSNPTPSMDDTAPTEPVPAAAVTTPLPDVASAPAPVPSQAPSDPSGLTDRARQLLVPVADPEPRPAAAPSVAPVLPGRPVPQRPQVVRAPGEELGADGGTPCPWCGTRNRPDRHFCTRCAMPMTGEAQSPGRLPWWRRLFGAGNRETPWAGDRPRLRRAFDRVLTWLGAAVVLTLLIVGAVNLPQGIQATRDHFSKRAPVDPDSYSASRSYPGHKPDLAFDKFNNTWWGPGVSDSGQGQWIEAKFNEPTRLLDLRITPGVSTRADQLQQSARPHRIEATVTLANGKKTTRQLVLDQGPGSQREPFRVGEVTAVRFTIESAYGTDASKQVAIAEIEFYGPSNANSS
ncbi:zinc ribbon domain-containing protein [Streptomyces sp. NPDC006476]|uniref:NADase-type glycan-binding domain-containing protein n=1 Tax=Streptomyces sp. NPDC006476 TaxID=3157175 RepID=UPI0033B44C73